MWVVTNKGFMSVVAKDRHGRPSGPDRDAEVSVRFRRPEDAARLFPRETYVPTPGGDYAGRVFVSRGEVAVVLAYEALGIDYTNFKDSIPKKDDPLYKAANAAWAVFGKLQDGGPYSRGLRSSAASPGPLFGSARGGGGWSGFDRGCDLCGAALIERWDGADATVCAACRADMAAEESAATGEVPSACWSCDGAVAPGGVLDPDTGLCESCAPLYTEADRDVILSVARGMKRPGSRP